MIYLTGDTHGSFERIEMFCKKMNTTKDDILIILGDAGINYSGPHYDEINKRYIQSMPITLFCIHGNHEQRPYTIKTYEEKLWHEGTVYYEEKFPDILFGKDGEIYNLNNNRCIVIGGAYSVDKMVRLVRGYHWWSDEQPSQEIKQYVESQLENNSWEIDVVLSHTTPKKYEPTEMFIKGFNQNKVDKSTEIWLDEIEDRLNYKKWYCGHFHIAKKIDNIQIMFEDYDVLD